MTTFLAIDFGERRTGVAVGETDTGLVSPLLTLQRSSDPQLIGDLLRTASSQSSDQLILGLPVLNDGTEGDAALRVRSFGKKLSEAFGEPVALVTETLTSRAARERIAARSGGKVSKRSKRSPPPHQQLDAVAAQLIGEQYLADVLTQRSGSNEAEPSKEGAGAA